MRKLTLTVFGLAIGLSLSTPAMACKFVMPKTVAEREAAANETVSRASAIINAKVIQVSETKKGEVAVLQPTLVIKGPKYKKRFTVISNSSCHRYFKKGEKIEILLFGGPKTYTADLYPSSDDDIAIAIAEIWK